MSDLPGSVVQEVGAAAEAARTAEWLEVAAALQRAGSAAHLAGWRREGLMCWGRSDLLRRVGGDPARVVEATSRGAMLGQDGLSTLFRSRVAEALAREAADDFVAAAIAYEEAVATGARLDLPGWIVATLERRRADRLLRAGDRGAAWRGYDAAAERHRGAGNLVAYGWVAVEQAHRACSCGAIERGLSVASRLELERAARGDSHLRAERAFARARLWYAGGDVRAAAAEARAGVEAAAGAGDPGACFAAGCLLAEIKEGEDGPGGAFSVMEATAEQLAAIVGAPLALAWVRRLFEQARTRWGTSRFEEIRAAHARARRGVLYPASRRPLP